MTGASVVYGVGPVLEALRARRRRVRRVWLAEGKKGGDRRIEAIARAAAQAGVPVERARRDELSRRAQGGVHQGVVAEAEPLPRVALEPALAAGGDPALVLALDGVQDPQNLGAILRSAACAGAAMLVVPKDRAAPLTPAAVKVAEGAAEHVPVVEVVNLRRALESLQAAGLWITGLEAGAARAWDELDYTGPTALVLGSEGEGLRRLVREACDHLAAVPVHGRIESLNVSAAAAVVLFEAVRQRRGGGGDRGGAGTGGARGAPSSPPRP